jgi:hypothetical protein
MDLVLAINTAMKVMSITGIFAALVGAVLLISVRSLEQKHLKTRKRNPAH